MKTIYKYECRIHDTLTISMPKGAMVLSVQVQRGMPCIWALVDTEEPQTTHKFHWLGTGEESSIPLEKCWYLGTVQLAEGSLVFHLFEEESS